MVAVVGGEILTIVPVTQLSPGRIGPLFIGMVFDLFFVGILCCQVWSYYTYFPKDRTWIKRLVALVFCLSITKAAISSSVVWEQIIVKSIYAQTAATYPWNIRIGPIMTATITTAAQSFFLWRCFNLTGKNRYLLATLLTIMLSTIAFAIAIVIYFPQDGPDYRVINIITIPMLVNSIVVDAVITAIVVYKLTRSLKEGFSGQTDSALKKMRIITFESALPPTVNQVINLIVFRTASGGHMWHAQLNMLSCRLYVFSFMYTLNARANIRSHPVVETISLHPGLPASRRFPGEYGLGNALARAGSNESDQPRGISAFRTRMETFLFNARPFKRGSTEYSGHGLRA